MSARDSKKIAARMHPGALRLATFYYCRAVGREDWDRDAVRDAELWVRRAQVTYIERQSPGGEPVVGYRIENDFVIEVVTSAKYTKGGMGEIEANPQMDYNWYRPTS